MTHLEMKILVGVLRTLVTNDTTLEGKYTILHEHR